MGLVTVGVRVSLFRLLLDPFPSIELSRPALIGGCVPNLMASCYAVFS